MANAHPHEHEHEHHGTTAPPSHGSGGLSGLMLDIGEEVGALIVHTDPVFDDREIEVSSPAAGEGRRIHAVVHPHRVGEDIEHAAVFVELAAGRYTVWAPEGTGIWGTAVVEGGDIARLDARSSAFS